MSEKLEIEVGPDGTIRTIYQDGIDKLLGAEIVNVKRASRVEFEEVAIDGKIERGWTIRAEYDPELALRAGSPPDNVPEYVSETLNHLWFQVSRNPKFKLVAFENREQALRFEREFFWDLLPPKERT
jgi:hypothetical protein